MRYPEGGNNLSILSYNTKETSACQMCQINNHSLALVTVRYLGWQSKSKMGLFFPYLNGYNPLQWQ